MWFIGSGYVSETEHLAKCIVESVCIGSVNAFVLISGWFGIRGGLNKIGDLAFMLLFCTIPLLILALAIGWLPILYFCSFNSIYDYVLGGNNYWFVADYIGLLIIAPILNKGIDSIDKNLFARTLITGYSLIAIYDFVFRSPAIGSEGGYSILWFGYLYLLARYMRLYGMSYISRYCWLVLLFSIVLQSLLFYFGLIGLRYTNPLILIEAVCLIYIFKDWNFQNNIVNYAAKACLMAYLIHMQPILVPYFSRFLVNQYDCLGYWLYILEVIVLSVAVFVVAIPINQLQSVIYQRIKSCLSL